MNWKTCSVEAGAGISKSKRLGGVSARSMRAGASCRDSERPLRRISRGTPPALLTQPRLALHSSFRHSGMQNHRLTMFATTCYIKWVPRVHPGLLCAVGSSARLCAWKIYSEAVEHTFPSAMLIRRLSSLKRSCGAFRPIVEGYAGQG